MIYSLTEKHKTGGGDVKITVKQDERVSETEITVVCRSLDAETAELLSALSLAGNSVSGKLGDETFFIRMSEIFYFESVDGRIFFYTECGTYETQTKLYRLEESLKNTSFARISKSVIANLNKLRSIKPESNGRFIATLVNGERLVVSRQYIRDIKKKLGV